MPLDVGYRDAAAVPVPHLEERHWRLDVVLTLERAAPFAQLAVVGAACPVAGDWLKQSVEAEAAAAPTIRGDILGCDFSALAGPERPAGRAAHHFHAGWVRDEDTEQFREVGAAGHEEPQAGPEPGVELAGRVRAPVCLACRVDRYRCELPVVELLPPVL